jgi:hypothetical protein
MAGAHIKALSTKARISASISRTATAKAFMAVIEQAVDVKLDSAALSVKLDSAALSAKLDMCNVNVSLE